MNCKHCNIQLPPDAVFCPNCGERRSEGSERNESVSAASAENVAAVRSASAAGFETHIAFAYAITALSITGCGAIVNTVLGIGAIISANQAENHFRSSDRSRAQECANRARTLCLAAVCFLIFQLFFAFLAGLLMLIASRYGS